MRLAFQGHRPVRRAHGDWRCICGARLSGGPCGSGRIGARDVMRFHRLDLLATAQGRQPIVLGALAQEALLVRSGHAD